MAKDKEKSINPAAAARKAEKAKALKKGKAAVAQQRNDRLAKQNPHRIQSQIDDLKALEANHSINPREKKQLDELERELARVVKAKEAAGEKYVPRTNQLQQGQTGGSNSAGVLGKRARGDTHGHGHNGRRDRRYHSPPSSDTDADVHDIPMPRDTPPPVPRRRREDAEKQDSTRTQHDLPDKPETALVAVTPSQAVYEAKPVLRDLRKEAAAFVPAAVRNRRQVDGGGGNATGGVTSSGKAAEGVEQKQASLAVELEKDQQQNDTTDLELQRLQEEEEQWRRETKQVMIEEVEDEDA